MTGADLPRLVTEVPGPRSRALVARLAKRECPGVTVRRARRAGATGRPDDDPIVWAEALGANVQDVDGNVFVDLTAGFGVASAGHRAPAVVDALAFQAGRLLHAMGDAFPDPTRIALLEALSELSGLDRAILGSSGSDAVEAALKTARLATGRDGLLAFEGGYHGLSYGALAATSYQSAAMREPFRGQLGGHVRHAPHGGPIPSLDGVGAVLVEPIQGRGGIRVPPEGWLRELQDRAHAAGALFVLDEVYTGFGRTGTWFAFQSEGLAPDLVCVGKGMAGGFPISACLGTEEAMSGWARQPDAGMAIHTQTFLGNPVGCAMALANIGEVRKLLPAVAGEGEWFRREVEARSFRVRGRGLMLGVEVPDALAVSRALLRRGYIALPAGERAPVLAVIPPLSICREQLAGFAAALGEVA